MASQSYVEIVPDSQGALLGLFITNKCNIRCRHCGTNSGPRERGVLQVHDLLPPLKSLLAAGIVRGLHVSGGEPFLYPRELAHLGQACRDAESQFIINTNGYWAPTVQAAGARLRQIPGVTRLFLSSDIYHAEFLAFERIKNAAAAAMSMGIAVTVSFCTPNGVADEYTLMCQDASRLLDCDLLTIQSNSLERGGRADAIPEANWRDEANAPPSDLCVQINKPVILENGVMLACCNTEAIPRSVARHPLIVGNVHETPIEDLLRKKNHDPLLRAIRLMGPGALAGLLPSHLAEKLSGRYQQGLPCSVCLEILAHDDLVLCLREIIEQQPIAAYLNVLETLQPGHAGSVESIPSLA